jgi:hypothetical protein
MRRTVVLLAVFAAAATLAACGASTEGLQSVRDSDRLMFFEIPSEWTVFEGGDLEGVAATPFVAQAADFSLPVVSRVVFQGASRDAGYPASSISQIEYPVGSAVVRTISTSQRDLMSRYWLAELVLPYHAQPVAQEVLKEDVSIGQDFDGVQLIVAYTDGDTESDAVVALVSITDPEVERLFSIAVGCSIDCFSAHQETIIDVIDSWLVNTR